MVAGILGLWSFLFGIPPLASITANLKLRHYPVTGDGLWAALGSRLVSPDLRLSCAGRSSLSHRSSPVAWPGAARIPDDTIPR